MKNIPDCNYRRRTGGKGNGRQMCGCAACEQWRNARAALFRRRRERRLARARARRAATLA